MPAEDAAGPAGHEADGGDPADAPAAAASADGRRSLAEKIDHLFKTVHPGRREFSIAHVSRATQADGDPGISVATLWALRAGTRDNPTMRNLQALADFFGVPAQYFFDDAVTERIDEQLAMVTALRDAPVRAITMRASGLSQESLEMIADMVERVRKMEGLPDVPMLEDGASPDAPERDRTT